MKYVIFSPPRTGSMLLCQALDAHSQITCGFEALNPGIAPRTKSILESICPDVDSLVIPDDGGKILDINKHDFRPFLDRVFQSYTGFKIIYSHIPPECNLWEHLNAYDDLKIIYMRRNWLEACLSFRLAKMSGIWWQNQDGTLNIKDRPFHFPSQEVKWYFDKYSNREAETREKLNKPSITIEHQDLISDWSQTISELESFLDISQEELPMLQTKRTTGSPESMILNYLELKREFFGTKYESIFGLKSFL